MESSPPCYLLPLFSPSPPPSSFSSPSSLPSLHPLHNDDIDDLRNLCLPSSDITCSSFPLFPIKTNKQSASTAAVFPYELPSRPPPSLSMTRHSSNSFIWPSISSSHASSSSVSSPPETPRSIHLRSCPSSHHRSSLCHYHNHVRLSNLREQHRSSGLSSFTTNTSSRLSSYFPSDLSLSFSSSDTPTPLLPRHRSLPSSSSSRRRCRRHSPSRHFHSSSSLKFDHHSSAYQQRRQISSSNSSSSHHCSNTSLQQYSFDYFHRPRCFESSSSSFSCNLSLPLSTPSRLSLVRSDPSSLIAESEMVEWLTLRLSHLKPSNVKRKRRENSHENPFPVDSPDYFSYYASSYSDGTFSSSSSPPPSVPESSLTNFQPTLLLTLEGSTRPTAAAETNRSSILLSSIKMIEESLPSLPPPPSPLAEVASPPPLRLPSASSSSICSSSSLTTSNRDEENDEINSHDEMLFSDKTSSSLQRASSFMSASLSSSSLSSSLTVSDPSPPPLLSLSPLDSFLFSSFSFPSSSFYPCANFIEDDEGEDDAAIAAANPFERFSSSFSFLSPPSSDNEKPPISLKNYQTVCRPPPSSLSAVMMTVDSDRGGGFKTSDSPSEFVDLNFPRMRIPFQLKKNDDEKWGEFVEKLDLTEDRTKSRPEEMEQRKRHHRLCNMKGRCEAVANVVNFPFISEELINSKNSNEITGDFVEEDSKINECEELHDENSEDFVSLMLSTPKDLTKSVNAERRECLSSLGKMGLNGEYHSLPSVSGICAAPTSMSTSSIVEQPPFGNTCGTRTTTMNGRNNIFYNTINESTEKNLQEDLRHNYNTSSSSYALTSASLLPSCCSFAERAHWIALCSSTLPMIIPNLFPSSSSISPPVVGYSSSVSTSGSDSSSLCSLKFRKERVCVKDRHQQNDENDDVDEDGDDTNKEKDNIINDNKNNQNNKMNGNENTIIDDDENQTSTTSSSFHQSLFIDSSSPTEESWKLLIDAAYLPFSSITDDVVTPRFHHQQTHEHPPPSIHTSFGSSLLDLNCSFLTASESSQIQSSKVPTSSSSSPSMSSLGLQGESLPITFEFLRDHQSNCRSLESRDNKGKDYQQREEEEEEEDGGGDGIMKFSSFSKFEHSNLSSVPKPPSPPRLQLSFTVLPSSHRVNYDKLQHEAVESTTRSFLHDEMISKPEVKEQQQKTPQSHLPLKIQNDGNDDDELCQNMKINQCQLNDDEDQNDFRSYYHNSTRMKDIMNVRECQTSSSLTFADLFITSSHSVSDEFSCISGSSPSSSNSSSSSHESLSLGSCHSSSFIISSPFNPTSISSSFSTSSSPVPFFPLSPSPPGAADGPDSETIKSVQFLSTSSSPSLYQSRPTSSGISSQRRRRNVRRRRYHEGGSDNILNDENLNIISIQSSSIQSSSSSLSPISSPSRQTSCPSSSSFESASSVLQVYQSSNEDALRSDHLYHHHHSSLSKNVSSYRLCRALEKAAAAAASRKYSEDEEKISSKVFEVYCPSSSVSEMDLKKVTVIPTIDESSHITDGSSEKQIITTNDSCNLQCFCSSSSSSLLADPLELIVSSKSHIAEERERRERSSVTLRKLKNVKSEIKEKTKGGGKGGRSLSDSSHLPLNSTDIFPSPFSYSSDITSSSYLLNRDDVEFVINDDITTSSLHRINKGNCEQKEEEKEKEFWPFFPEGSEDDSVFVSLSNLETKNTKRFSEQQQTPKAAAAAVSSLVIASETSTAVTTPEKVTRVISRRRSTSTVKSGSKKSKISSNELSPQQFDDCPKNSADMIESQLRNMDVGATSITTTSSFSISVSPTSSTTYPTSTPSSPTSSPSPILSSFSISSSPPPCPSSSSPTSVFIFSSFTSSPLDHPDRNSVSSSSVCCSSTSTSSSLSTSSSVLSKTFSSSELGCTKSTAYLSATAAPLISFPSKCVVGSSSSLPLPSFPEKWASMDCSVPVIEKTSFLSHREREVQLEEKERMCCNSLEEENKSERGEMSEVSHLMEEFKSNFPLKEIQHVDCIAAAKRSASDDKSFTRRQLIGNTDEGGDLIKVIPTDDDSTYAATTVGRMSSNSSFLTPQSTYSCLSSTSSLLCAVTSSLSSSSISSSSLSSSSISSSSLSSSSISSSSLSSSSITSLHLSSTSAASLSFSSSSFSSLTHHTSISHSIRLSSVTADSSSLSSSPTFCSKTSFSNSSSSSLSKSSSSADLLSFISSPSLSSLSTHPSLHTSINSYDESSHSEITENRCNSNDCKIAAVVDSCCPSVTAFSRRCLSYGTSYDIEFELVDSLLPEHEEESQLSNSFKEPSSLSEASLFRSSSSSHSTAAASSAVSRSTKLLGSTETSVTSVVTTVEESLPKYRRRSKQEMLLQRMWQYEGFRRLTRRGASKGQSISSSSSSRQTSQNSLRFTTTHSSGDKENDGANVWRRDNKANENSSRLKNVNDVNDIINSNDDDDQRVKCYEKEKIKENKVVSSPDENDGKGMVMREKEEYSSSSISLRHPTVMFTRSSDMSHSSSSCLRKSQQKENDDNEEETLKKPRGAKKKEGECPSDDTDDDEIDKNDDKGDDGSEIDSSNIEIVSISSSSASRRKRKSALLECSSNESNESANSWKLSVPKHLRSSDDSFSVGRQRGCRSSSNTEIMNGEEDGKHNGCDDMASIRRENESSLFEVSGDSCRLKRVDGSDISDSSDFTGGNSRSFSSRLSISHSSKCDKKCEGRNMGDGRLECSGNSSNPSGGSTSSDSCRIDNNRTRSVGKKEEDNIFVESTKARTVWLRRSARHQKAQLDGKAFEGEFGSSLCLVAVNDDPQTRSSRINFSPSPPSGSYDGKNVKMASGSSSRSSDGTSSNTNSNENSNSGRKSSRNRSRNNSNWNTDTCSSSCCLLKEDNSNTCDNKITVSRVSSSTQQLNERNEFKEKGYENGSSEVSGVVGFSSRYRRRRNQSSRKSNNRNDSSRCGNLNMSNSRNNRCKRRSNSSKSRSDSSNSGGSNVWNVISSDNSTDEVLCSSSERRMRLANEVREEDDEKDNDGNVESDEESSSQRPNKKRKKKKTELMKLHESVEDFLGRDMAGWSTIHTARRASSSICDVSSFPSLSLLPTFSSSSYPLSSCSTLQSSRTNTTTPSTTASRSSSSTTSSSCCSSNPSLPSSSLRSQICAKNSAASLRRRKTTTSNVVVAAAAVKQNVNKTRRTQSSR